MPALVTPAQVREHVETDLGDTALQRLIDDADALIVARFGPHTGNVIETIAGGGEHLFLARPASAIVSVSEVVDDVASALAASDYRSWWGGQALQRAINGTNPSSFWGDRVTVTYTPVDESARRTRIELDLVRLAIQYDATRSSTVGDFSQTNADYATEREAIVGVLAPPIGVA